MCGSSNCCGRNDEHLWHLHKQSALRTDPERAAFSAIARYRETFRRERKNETIQSKTTAPTSAVMRLPKRLAGAQPKRPKIQPPSNPPTIPITMLSRKPDPRPFIIKLASHPAAKPIRINHKKYITQRFLRIKLSEVNYSAE